MNYEHLFKLQRELDEKIMTVLNNGVQLHLEKKILALFSEIGELANETRCFKYWSKKVSSDKEVILSEYVDGLHFYISIALDLFSDVNNIFSKLPQFLSIKTEVNKEAQVQAFLEVYRTINEFKHNPTLEAFIIALEQYLFLGYTLGVTVIEIEKAYLQKNQINHKRQQTGY